MERDLYPYLNMRVEFDSVSIQLWLHAIVILIALTVVMGFRKRSLSYLICFFIFGAYILYAVDKVFFPIPVTGAYANAMKEAPWSAFINLIPFYFGPYVPLEAAANTLFLNVLLTLPFGFGINFLIPTTRRKILWMAFGVGFGLEITQLIIGLLLGYLYRYIDINDVLMNASGVFVGYALFRIFAWVYLWVINRLNIKPWGLAAYVYAAARLSSAQPASKAS